MKRLKYHATEYVGAKTCMPPWAYRSVWYEVLSQGLPKSRRLRPPPLPVVLCLVVVITVLTFNLIFN